MATSWLKALHVNKGKTIAQTIKDRTDYAENPNKTQQGELVTGYECDPRTVDTEFLLSKKEYASITGRDQGKHDVLAYHIRQAFKPGEITPEKANEIGYQLGLRFTKSNHAFIVATHIDKSHIHNHIVFNSTALDSTKKYKDFLRSARALRKLSDIICLENGLSIIENPKPSKGNYSTWLGDKKEPTWREKLEKLIDGVLANKPVDFQAFIKLLEEANCQVKQGKHISLKMAGQKKFIRLRSLSDDYSEDAICERIAGKRMVAPKIKHTPISQPTQPTKVNLLINIQNSIKAQNSPGYERWAKIFNLKQAAQTLIFLQENDITEFEKLQEKAQQAKDDFNAINTGIKAADTRMKEITALQKHIGIYSKTKDVYVEYRKSGYSKKYLATHESEIVSHKTSKKVFDELKLEKLPSIKSLQTEYATLSAEKKKLYSRYHEARKFSQEILVARQNVEQLLNYKDAPSEKKNERTQR